MSINQLQSLLRQSETFSIREVAYCYLEIAEWLEGDGLFVQPQKTRDGSLLPILKQKNRPYVSFPSNHDSSVRFTYNVFQVVPRWVLEYL
jgi:hypothetical protein